MTDLKSVIHLYKGCLVKTILGVYTADIISGDTVRTGKHAGTFICFIDECTLLLRPLSDMIEEESIALVKLSEWEQYGNHPFKREYSCYKNSFGKTVVSWGETAREKNIPANKTHFTPAEFTYLLSIGIDLFQLIENGFALDKNKMK